MEESHAFMNAVITRARGWIDESFSFPTPYSSQLLARVLSHPHGLEFMVEFVDGVIRPEDSRVAAHNLAHLAQKDLSFLPPAFQILTKAARLAPIAPVTAQNMALSFFRELVGDLVISANEKTMGSALARLRQDGSRLNVNLLGEAVLGEKEAHSRLKAICALIRRKDIDYVSLKVSSVIGPHAPFAHEDAVSQAVRELTPVYRLAQENSTFINLDMEEYKDLALTVDTFCTLLEKREFHSLRAGIVLQAYLPDSFAYLEKLTTWAKERRARGGAPIKIRIVKGANLMMERVEARIRGWNQSVWEEKTLTDAHYMKMLDYALRKEHIDAVHIGAAGMNLYTIAYAYEKARERGIRPGEGFDIEMLSGMASAQAKAVSNSVGPLLYYVPVVRPQEFDVAVAYLVRRLEENTAAENFMKSIFQLHSPQVREREENRFTQAYYLSLGELSHTSRRIGQAHTAPACAKVDAHSAYANCRNTPDLDSSLPHVCAQAQKTARSSMLSTLGSSHAETARVRIPQEIFSRIYAARTAHIEWAELSCEKRAEYLRECAREIAAHRFELIEVMMSEAHKLFDQADSEVSEAIDFANYYAASAQERDAHENVVAVPKEVTAVLPPWNFPLAICAGGIFAALASGSAVIVKPAAPTRRVGAYLHSLLENILPHGVCQLVDFDPDENPALARELIEGVDSVILTGATQTAQLISSWNPRVAIHAETSGKNAIIVTESADIDLALKDVIASAFGHSGQKCSAASLVILVSSVGYSQRFARQLIDGIASLKVGQAWDISTQLGPLIAPPTGKLANLLEEDFSSGKKRSEAQPHWILRPRKIAENLYTPGVLADVTPMSDYHLREYFGPVLGIMRVDSLEEALEMQNATDFGLTGGIHSLSSQEIEYWLEHVKVGNAYVNRTITGAIVSRQPFGGWKHSRVGGFAKAGGPNYVHSLCSFEKAPEEEEALSKRSKKALEWAQNDPLASEYVTQLRKYNESLNSRNFHNAASSCEKEFDEADSISPRRNRTNTPAVDVSELARLLFAFHEAWEKEFSHVREQAHLEVEKNLFRYRLFDLPVLRVEDPRCMAPMLAYGYFAQLTGSNIEINTSFEVPSLLMPLLNACHVLTHNERDFVRSLEQSIPNPDGVRVRFLGAHESDIAALKERLHSIEISLISSPVVENGVIEGMWLFNEQAVSLTNHRFGNPTRVLSFLTKED